ncbi:MAG: glycine-rich domain-containing protein [Burkholderiales bacterium]
MRSGAKRSTRQMIEAIEALDLGPIKFKLMDPEEGEGWSREFVEHMELQYKRYLTLVAKYPRETIAPAKDLDRFWHAHILDTRKYMDDCERVFGFYLHHFPYFGMRGADDAAALARAGERTRELYEAEFGAGPGSTDSAFCSVAREAFCSVAAAAFCSVAGAAFCSVTAGRHDTRTRPSLPPLA